MTIAKFIFSFLALVLFMISCSDPKNALVESNAEDKSHNLNSLTDNIISISPVDATVKSIITLKTDGSLLNNGEVYWYINDIRETSINEPRFISDNLKKGDVVKARIVTEKKEFESNEIIIKNTPPRITRARILPSIPKVGSILKVQIEAHDVDNDIISFKYYWTANGNFAGEDNYLDTEIKRDDLITVVVTPYDNDDQGKEIKLNSRVYNSPPVFSETSPSIEGKFYKYEINASDPDKDELTFKLEQAPEGMIINPDSGKISWELKTEDVGYHEVKVRITDNNGGEILVPVNTKIILE